VLLCYADTVCCIGAAFWLWVMGEVSYVHRSCGFCKVLKWKKIRPVEVLKMAIGPEKVLILVSVILENYFC